MDIDREHSDTFELAQVTQAHRYPGSNTSLSEDDHPERSSPGSVNDEACQTYSAKEERAVVKKLDNRLVLFLAILYLFSFLDRSSKSIDLMKRNNLDICC